MISVNDGDVILFQGDSITDTGRVDSPDGLGGGYVSIVNGLLGSDHSAPCVKILNRGVSGDRTAELLARWKADCEGIKPRVLSIMIGVNDVWRIVGEWNGQTYIDPGTYLENYRNLLDRALAAGIRQLVLCSPTMIANGTDARLRGLLAERKEIVKRLASEYKAVYVPTQERQLELLESRPDIRWTIDGCHPTLTGHVSLARAWLAATGL
jgi:lysophospholipase L1-like esterase